MKNQWNICAGVICAVMAVSAAAADVANGGFERGAYGWTLLGDGVTIVTNGNAHSGAAFLDLQSVPEGDEFAYQDIALSSNAVAASLNCYYRNLSTNTLEAATFSVNLSFTLTNNGSNSTVVTNLLSKSSLDTNSAPGAYSFGTWDLTPFLGFRQLGIQFRMSSSTTAGSVFAVDDVSVAETFPPPANDSFTNRFTLGGANASLLASNSWATKEAGEPNHAGNPGGKSVWYSWTAPAYGTVKASATSATFTNLLAAYTGADLGSLAPLASGSGSPSNSIQFSVVQGVEYELAVDGADGASGPFALSLVFTRNTQPPVLTFASPSPWATLLTSNVTVSGEVSDITPLTQVWYQLNTNDWALALGTTNWSAAVTLAPGINTLQAYAVDANGNRSATNGYSFSFSPAPTLFLRTNGPGTISGGHNGQSLVVGRTYSLSAQAKRGSGYVFSNWVGSILTNTPTLVFKARTNLVLQANFVPNPFLKLADTYAGLFWETGKISIAAVPGPTNPPLFISNVGSVSVTVSSLGAFSASLRQGGARYSFSGQFDLHGAWSSSSVRGTPNLGLSLQLDPDQRVLSGQIASSGAWSGSLLAYQTPFDARTNRAPGAGAYTLVIPGSTNPASFPGGNSAATLTLSPAGAVSLSGKLADGTAFSASSTVSQAEAWPLYVPLYANKGFIFGWLNFTNDVAGSNRIEGSVNWSKPAKYPLYPNGFVYVTDDIIGSTWTNHAPYLTWTNGVVELQGGNRALGLTNALALSAKGKFTDQTLTNKLKLSLTPASGAWSGSFVDAKTRKTVTLNGVFLQQRDVGYGYFIGTNQSGGIYLGRP